MKIFSIQSDSKHANRKEDVLLERARPKIQHVVPGKWQIRHGFRACAHIDVYTKKAVLPLGNKKNDRLRRLHELGHVKWSPLDIGAACQEITDYAIDEELLHSLEDNRINRALKKKKIPIWDMIRELYIDELSETLDVLTDLEKAQAFLAFSGTKIPYIDNIRNRIYETMNGYDRALLSDAEDVLREAGSNTVMAENEEDSINEFNKVLEVAKVLTYWFDTGKTETKVRKEMVSDDEVNKSLEGYLKEGALDAMRMRLKKVPTVRVTNRKIDWGTMRIVKPPLEQRPVPHKKTLQETLSETGIIMKHPHRLLTDKKIFTDKRKVLGGTLLIDVSGSMVITEYELDKLLDIAPLLTVALYTSEFYTYFSGMLVIVAEKDRRCSREKLTFYTGYGNVIDGPALRWLADQEHPRIWVSDGIVTGLGDLNNPELSKEAYSIVRDANILRIANLATAIDWFTQRAIIRRNKFTNR
jgi:hypothetical protein